MQAISGSPSLNSYSSDLTDIAARVVAECAISTHSDDESQLELRNSDDVSHVDDNEDDDFEFSFVCRESESSPISADEIFSNGRIKPLFPICESNSPQADQKRELQSSHRNRSPLRKLFIEDRPAPVSTSSVSDGLQSLPSESYCLWNPNVAPGRGKKTNASGSSKRWKIMNLLDRSNSDRKTGFIPLIPRSKSISISGNEKKKIDHSNEKKTDICCEISCRDKRDSTEDDNKMAKNGVLNSNGSKKDVVRFLPNVNDLSRSVHPF